ncbi:hypothetical protein [Ramlibacter rhizophilus]|uniref:Uncharacterized protein n=1 Tax=Ramlibacter rhizophilus TaxID=1781167 RepID=A0A4Z0BQ62_9BURK|nr:hypothetical protein [Ramlibacter rhizophilus]TFZ01433.1 hypothetical protein EZ242_08635 [Ramlibacter rhizophilus]
MTQLHSTGSDRHLAPRLEEFRARAQDNDFVCIAPGAGGAMQVLGTSLYASASTGRTEEVHWVSAPGSTAALFKSALTQAYGERLAEQLTSGVFQLDTSSVADVTGKRDVLASEQILERLAAADCAREALQGVDFASLARYSAVSSGPCFRSVLESLGMSLSAVSAEQRVRIDEQLRDYVAAEAALNRSPASTVGLESVIKKALTAVD